MFVAGPFLLWQFKNRQLGSTKLHDHWPENLQKANHDHLICTYMSRVVERLNYPIHSRFEPLNVSLLTPMISSDPRVVHEFFTLMFLGCFMFFLRLEYAVCMHLHTFVSNLMFYILGFVHGQIIDTWCIPPRQIPILLIQVLRRVCSSSVRHIMASINEYVAPKCAWFVEKYEKTIIKWFRTVQQVKYLDWGDYIASTHLLHHSIFRKGRN